VVQIKKSLKDYLNPNYIPLEKKVFAQPQPIQEDQKPKVPVPAKPTQKSNTVPGGKEIQNPKGTQGGKESLNQPANRNNQKDVLKPSEIMPPSGGTKKG
jgi:hypothetical protein